MACPPSTFYGGHDIAMAKSGSHNIVMARSGDHDTQQRLALPTKNSPSVALGKTFASAIWAPESGSAC